MKPTNDQSASVEQINAKVVSMIKQNQSRMRALSKRIEKLEANPKATMSLGIRPKDMIFPCNCDEDMHLAYH